MKNTAEHGLRVPPPLAGLVTDRFLEAHDRVKSLTLEQLRADMPELQTDAEAGIRFVELAPSYDYDPAEAILAPYQFATPHTESQHLRLKLLTEYTGKRVLGFPNNARGHHGTYHFTAGERNTIRTGDLKPLAHRIGRAAASAGVEQAVIAGYSQAAGVSMELETLAEKEGFFEVEAAFHGEPANVVNRTEEQLTHDIRKDGIRGLIGAIRDAGLPVLNEIQGVDSHVHVIQFASHIASFAANAGLKDNLALKTGLSRDGFVKIGAESHPSHPSVIVRAAHSLVTPGDTFDYHRENWENNGFSTVELASYGHAAAHNVAAFALMAGDLAYAVPDQAARPVRPLELAA